MNYDNIKLATLDVFQKFNILSFPIDCKDMIKQFGMKIESYSEQKPSKLKRCLAYSDDAFTLKNVIYYNDKKPEGRIRFSLAHEIGHIALGHTVPRTDIQEKEADLFASYLLAPRMAIHYSGCKNQNNVSKLFNLSQEAAQYAFDDYKRWHRWTVYHKMNAFDKAMYMHFYNKDLDKFVYKIKQCAFCNQTMYNTTYLTCKKCEIPQNPYTQMNTYEELEFRMAESHWLYGGI